MPALKRAPNEKELEKLIRLFLKAETDIINEIGRLRSQGLVDYHAVAALERVQLILRKLESDCWEYVPKMIEKQFYVRVPEARKILEPAEFQSTPPMREATGAGCRGSQASCRFQSTPPIREATAVAEFIGLSFVVISIHASHTGGDRCLIPYADFRFISIHASHTGGDQKWIWSLNMCRISIHASHTGGDGRDHMDIGSNIKISIHASHTGGDLVCTLDFCLFFDFNPRLPYGRRRPVCAGRPRHKPISIHASHTGGDLGRVVFDKKQGVISIHASHTGGDAVTDH